MSIEILTLLLCLVVIVIAGASYPRRRGSQAPTHPRAALAAAIAVIVLALVLAGLVYVRRHGA
jgi:hypothetical protein